MSNTFVTAAAAVIAAFILFAGGAWRVLKAVGAILHLVTGLLVLTPYWALRRRVIGGDTVLHRRVNAARLIA